MFKTYSAILLFITLFSLVGCSNFNHGTDKNNDGAKDEQDADVATTSDKIDKEKSEWGATSDDTTYDGESENPEKLQHKLQSTVKKIHETMSKEQDTHDWFMLEDEHPDEFEQELERIKQPLSTFITDNELTQQARALLEVYTCFCDSSFIFEPKDTQTGFKITEKTKDTFKAETITLDDGYYGTGWTNKWTFKKEDGEWKLANYDYVFADDEPLQLTYEDIEHSYYNQETEKTEAVKFLEYLDIEGVPHLVIQRKSGDIEIYNTDTGVMNYTAMEQYARKD